MEQAHVLRQIYLVGMASLPWVSSTSKEVWVLFNLVSRNLQSTTGKNLKLIKERSGLDSWTESSHRLKKALHEKEVFVEDTWRTPYWVSLLEQLQEAKVLVQDDRAKILQGLIDNLVR